MKRRAHGELHARVVLIHVPGIELAQRIAPVTYACRATVECLRLVCAIAMALEANLKFVASPRQEAIAVRLSLHAQQGAAYKRRLGRPVRCLMRIMAVSAFCMSHRAYAGLRHRVCARIG